MKKKYAQLLKNTLLFGIGAFGSKILNFLFVPFYTNFLSTSDMGTADLVSTTATLFAIGFTMDIMDATLLFVAEGKQKKEDVLTVGIIVILAASFFVSISLFVLKAANIVGMDALLLVFLFVLFFLNSYNRLFSYYLQAINQVLEVSVAGIVQTFVTVGLNILFIAIFHFGAYGYLMAVTTGLFASLFYEQMSVRKSLERRLSIKAPSKKLYKEMLMFSFPLMLNSVFWWLNTSIDKYFVIGICGVEQNGIYSVAAKLPTLLTTILTIFLQAWSVSAIKDYDKDDRDGFFGNTYEFFNALATTLCSLLILLIIPLSRILFVKDFFIAWKPSAFLLLSGVFSALSSFIGSIFSAVKNSKVFLISTLAAAGVNMILNFFLIDHMGIIGAAVATVASFAVVWIIRYVLAAKYINWQIHFFKHIFGYFLLAIQILFSLQKSHVYALQLAILCFIIVVYWSQIKIILDRLGRILRRRIVRR